MRMGAAASAASNPWVPALLWLIGALGVFLAWSSYLSIPRRVVINGADVVFERPIGTLSMPILAILHIDVRAWNRGFVVLSTQRRKLYLLRHMPDLFTIVADITQHNPSTIVVGRIKR
jgi:hypothetical protein